VYGAPYLIKICPEITEKYAKNIPEESDFPDINVCTTF
jgi:hypothetical protein